MFMKLYMPDMFIVKDIEKVMTHVSFLLLKMLLGARISSRMIILYILRDILQILLLLSSKVR